jgi:hypothetical protein
MIDQLHDIIKHIITLIQDPKLKDVRVIDANAYGNQATLAWTYGRSCYNVTSIKIVYLKEDIRREVTIKADTQTHILRKLYPESEYQVNIYAIYEGDFSSEAYNINFKTGTQKEGGTK